MTMLVFGQMFYVSIVLETHPCILISVFELVIFSLQIKTVVSSPHSIKEAEKRKAIQSIQWDENGMRTFLHRCIPSWFGICCASASHRTTLSFAILSVYRNNFQGYPAPKQSLGRLGCSRHKCCWNRESPLPHTQMRRQPSQLPITLKPASYMSED
ncbi:hypothetical protein DdX_09005 [Ditylenchus destructor]|uniref:Uncharacterized protein n=1 Tax=Ditylenchus destructor TaxID=166010 RepID=A0AAD4N2L4_9BILA|nr:hypothetical protein DdX_09005 [Ditylenchus destructor]